MNGLWLFIQLGMIGNVMSSQVTNSIIFQRCSNHQPDGDKILLLLMRNRIWEKRTTWHDFEVRFEVLFAEGNASCFFHLTDQGVSLMNFVAGYSAHHAYSLSKLCDIMSLGVASADRNWRLHGEEFHGSLQKPRAVFFLHHSHPSVRTHPSTGSKWSIGWANLAFLDPYRYLNGQPQNGCRMWLHQGPSCRSLPVVPVDAIALEV